MASAASKASIKMQIEPIAASSYVSSRIIGSFTKTAWINHALYNFIEYWTFLLKALEVVIDVGFVWVIGFGFRAI